LAGSLPALARRGNRPAGPVILSARSQETVAMQVQSAAIREIDYEPEHGKLFVTFIDGDAYVYVGVPNRVREAFERASSKGRFFQRMIRDRYPYNRI